MKFDDSCSTEDILEELITAVLKTDKASRDVLDIIYQRLGITKHETRIVHKIV